ncbi:hypothetical protein [Sphingobacterium sp. BIGb0165]|uniref:hypothetical protein n=1 Tax=Sphingobacterium sp. BIGb0165 TaxID=2940615 RepID=UPI00216A8DC1|nr:hypothetical protein [Sphingobacterium sp. BIGb0165]MCS4226091.1 hypothetical protein [Sphingobacterium sp. BIGb0165]
MALFYGEAPLWDHLIIPHSPQNKPFRNEKLFCCIRIRTGRARLDPNFIIAGIGMGMRDGTVE